MRYPTGRPGMMFRTRLPRGVAWIFWLEAAFLVVFLLGGAAFRELAARWLILTPGSILQGHVWKLATTALLNFDLAGNIRLLNVFFDLLMLWMFVPILERGWGTRRFLTFAAATVLVGNVASVVAGLALAPLVSVVGISSFIYASIAAFGVEFGDQQVLFFGIMPMRGRSLAIGIVAFLALFVVLQGAWVEGAGYFAAMGVAWAMTRGVWQPNVWWLRMRRWRLRRRYRVLNGGGPDRKRWMN